MTDLRQILDGVLTSQASIPSSVELRAYIKSRAELMNVQCPQSSLCDPSRVASNVYSYLATFPDLVALRDWLYQDPEGNLDVLVRWCCLYLKKPHVDESQPVLFLNYLADAWDPTMRFEDVSGHYRQWKGPHSAAPHEGLTQGCWTQTAPDRIHNTISPRMEAPKPRKTPLSRQDTQRQSRVRETAWQCRNQDADWSSFERYLLIIVVIVIVALIVGILVYSSRRQRIALSNNGLPEPGETCSYTPSVDEISSKFSRFMPIEFFIVEMTDSEETEWGRVDPSRGFEVHRPTKITGDLWLECTLNSQRILLRFLEEPSGLGEPHRRRFRLAIGRDWDLPNTGVEILYVGRDKTPREPAGLNKGDCIHIFGLNNMEVACVEMLDDQGMFVLPVSTTGSFRYRLDSFDSLNHRVLSSWLDYVPVTHTLWRPVFQPNVKKQVLVDELTKTELDLGQRLISRDAVSGVVAAITFLPEDPSLQRDYYPSSLNPDAPENQPVVMRPQRVPCPFLCLDALTGQPVAKVSITCPEKAYYAENDRLLMLPPPQTVASLAEIELQFSSSGYKHMTRTLDWVGKQLARAKGQPIEVRMERTHTNIVVIWPASTGIGTILGAAKFTIPKLFLDELKNRLTETCRPLGYSVEVLILKDSGLTEVGDWSTMSYASADMPAAAIHLAGGQIQPYSIYEDPASKGRFGRHTAVVVFLGDFNPPQISRSSEQPVMHVHLAKLDRPDSNDLYVHNWCKETYDGKVSFLQMGDEKQMIENAKRLADDVTTELRGCLKK